MTPVSAICGLPIVHEVWRRCLAVTAPSPRSGRQFRLAPCVSAGFRGVPGSEPPQGGDRIVGEDYNPSEPAMEAGRRATVAYAGASRLLSAAALRGLGVLCAGSPRAHARG